MSILFLYRLANLESKNFKTVFYMVIPGSDVSMRSFLVPGRSSAEGHSVSSGVYLQYCSWPAGGGFQADSDALIG